MGCPFDPAGPNLARRGSPTCEGMLRGGSAAPAWWRMFPHIRGHAPNRPAGSDGRLEVPPHTRECSLTDHPEESSYRGSPHTRGCSGSAQRFMIGDNVPHQHAASQRPSPAPHPAPIAARKAPEEPGRGHPHRAPPPEGPAPPGAEQSPGSTASPERGRGAPRGRRNPSFLTPPASSCRPPLSTPFWQQGGTRHDPNPRLRRT